MYWGFAISVFLAPHFASLGLLKNVRNISVTKTTLPNVRVQRFVGILSTNLLNFIGLQFSNLQISIGRKLFFSDPVSLLDVE
jgi:hypothetical protein